jgi:Subtilase family
MPAHAVAWRQSEWWLSKLHVIQAWRSGEGAGVTIAVLADGVDASQADLTGRVISGPDFVGSQRNPGGPHYGVIGTGLASLIAGHGHGSNSASGIYGVASDARVLSVRVTLSPGDPLWSNVGVTSKLPADIAAGIRYAVNHDASVIALPADPGMPGIPGWGGARSAAGGSAAERAAIAYAVKHNVVLVAPAGDNAQAGDAPNFPAAYQGVIAVGAFGKNFVKAPYSSRRSYVTLTAAGRDVVAAAPSGYQTMNSTWAASAIAAGVASLVRSQFPNLSATQVRDAMTKGTFYQPQGGVATGSGYGTVDAVKAISQAAALSPPHARPASLGALPRRMPEAPAVPSNGSVIARDLVTDGIISAAVLAALLAPIMWYSSIVKRRERELAMAAAERAQYGRRGYGQGGMIADALLEYFEPQEAPPAIRGAGGRPVPGSRYQPRPALTGRSTLTSAFTPRPMLPAPPAAGGPSAQADPAARNREPDLWTSDSGIAQSSHTSDAWASADARNRQRPGQPGQTLRHAPVAGSPPWEPAPQPTSELPWAVYPGPAEGPAMRGTFGPAGPDSPQGAQDAHSPYSSAMRQAPPESVWEQGPVTRSSAPSSMFEPDPLEAPAERPDASRTDSGGRPIYVWDPES